MKKRSARIRQAGEYETSGEKSNQLTDHGVNFVVGAAVVLIICDFIWSCIRELF